jgi:hypothetical protein
LQSWGKIFGRIDLSPAFPRLLRGTIGSVDEDASSVPIDEAVLLMLGLVHPHGRISLVVGLPELDSLALSERIG